MHIPPRGCINWTTGKLHLLGLKTHIRYYPGTFVLGPPLLCTNAQILAYAEVFIYELIGLDQGPTHRRRHVRRTILHALDKVFRPLENMYTNQRKELLLLKKLDA